MTQISIITVAYNAEQTIRNCLDSICMQSVMPEHIIIDGNSVDNTLGIIQQYDNHFIKVISEPDDGIYDAMNKGLTRAKGDIVGFLNADDYYPEEDTLTYIKKVFNTSQIEACYGDLHYVDSKNTNKIIRNWRSGAFDQKKFYWGWMPPHPTFFVRKSVYEKFGMFNLDLGSAADYELMLRFIVRYKIKVAYISEVLVKMRLGGASNASLKKRLAANRMDREAWRVNGLTPYPWTIPLKPFRKIPQYFTRP